MSVSADQVAPADGVAAADGRVVPPRCPSERLEASGAGRAALSVLIVVLIAAMVVGNLPPSAVRSEVAPALRPLTATVGFEQSWSMFAPEPRSVVLRVRAEVTYDDGSVETWRPPTGAKLLGAWRVARWQKYVGYARADAFRARLWRPLAAWVARTHANRGAPARPGGAGAPVAAPRPSGLA